MHQVLWCIDRKHTTSILASLEHTRGKAHAVDVSTLNPTSLPISALEYSQTQLKRKRERVCVCAFVHTVKAFGRWKRAAEHGGALSLLFCSWPRRSPGLDFKRVGYDIVCFPTDSLGALNRPSSCTCRRRGRVGARRTAPGARLAGRGAGLRARLWPSAHTQGKHADGQSAYPRGTRQNDGLDTGIMGGCGREISVVSTGLQQ